MKIKYLVPFLIAAAFVLAVFASHGKFIIKPMKMKVLYGHKANYGPAIDDAAPEDEKDRLLWEFMRYQDPATGNIPSNIHQASLAYAQTLPNSLQQFQKNKNAMIQSEGWTQRGPANIGGRTRALALDVLDENTIIAGGVSGGMWRSNDAGKTWSKTTRPDQLQSTSCIAQDKRAGKENTWYLGTGEYFNVYGGLRGDGIYKSTDDGKSWEQLASTVSNTPQSWGSSFDYIWNIITDHTNKNQDIVYAATSLGAIQRSTDGGNTWKIVLGGFGNNYSWFTDIAISPTGVLFAAFSQKTFGSDSTNSSVKGIFRSTDGLNWTNITPSFMPRLYNRIVIGISPSDENQVYFLAETPWAGTMTINTSGDSLWHSIWKYNYISGDGTGSGGQWDDRSASIPAPQRIRSQFNSQGGYDLVIRVKPDNPDVVFIGGTNLYRSTDGFSTPFNTTLIGGYCPDDTSCHDIYTYTNHHADQHAIVFLLSDPNVLFSSSDGGVAVTYNNLAPHVDWESLNNGYFTTQFYSCAIDHAIAGSPEIVGGLQDNGTLYTNSNDKAKPWNTSLGADGFCSAIADSAKAYYVSNNSSRQPFIKVWKTLIDKNGLNTVQTRIDPDGASDMPWDTPFKLDPNDSRKMYLGGGFVLWRNNNLDLIPSNGSKDSTKIGWDSLSHTRLDSEFRDTGYKEKISAIGVSKSPANIVYYGTNFGRVFRINNADKGNPVPVEITGKIFPKTGENGYPANIGCIAVDPYDANKVFAVFTNFSVLSIFYSTNGGTNWASVSGNLEQMANGQGNGPAVNWLQILPIQGKFMYFAATTTGLYSTSYLDGDYTVWQMEGANSIGNVMMYMVDSRESDSYVVASTFGLGMFSANFTSLPSAPQAPVLLYPQNDSTGILLTQQLTWKGPDGAYFYKLQLSKDKDFNDTILNIDGLRTTSYNALSLEQGQVKYYWRVYARGAGGVSLPSETGSFYTATLPPEIVFPMDNADSVAVNFTFRWNTSNGADSYHLQVSTNGLFGQISVDTVVSALSCDMNGFASGKRYYWRISSIRNGQEGIFSDKYKFTTIAVTGITDNGYLEDGPVIIGNYPNPFAGKTRLDFYLKKEEHIIISLYDANGRAIRTICNGIYSKGEQAVTLDGAGLAKGVYYCILNTGKEKCVKKIIITR